MIRFLGIVSVIWGLMIQPLMAAVPAQPGDNGIYSRVVLAASISPHAKLNDKPDQDISESSKTSRCDESMDLSSEHCGDCDSGCGNSGLCTSSCVVSGVVVIQITALNFSLQNSTRITTNSKALVYRPPSPVFHPPKYS